LLYNLRRVKEKTNHSKTNILCYVV